MIDQILDVKKIGFSLHVILVMIKNHGIFLYVGHSFLNSSNIRGVGVAVTSVL